jgi:1A family penicillin-binding protein
MTLKYKKLQTDWLEKNKWKRSEKIEFNRKKLIIFSKKLFLPILLAVLLIFILIPVITYLYFVRDLSTKESIMNRNNVGVTLLDRNGEPFYSYYEAKQKTLVPISDVAKDFQNAVISVEDKTFYSHPGFSLRAILAAFWADVRRQEWRYGGSTITQQLVKNSLLSNEKSFLRKYQELVLAMEIERRFSKEEILEMYVNTVYFGEGAYGIGNASEIYFNKESKDLSLSESALLAGLPIAPSALSPISGNREQALKRYEFVLEEMVEQGVIASDHKDAALNAEFNFPEKKEAEINHAAHFALMVKDQLIEKYGEQKISQSGYKVHTTLDLKWQEHAEDQVYKQVKQLASSQVSNGAVVVMDPKTGEVRALVGSYDWYDNKFGKVNITTTPRQPGSAFKPIVYGAGLEKKIITPATVLEDRPITYEQTGGPDYKPVNYDGTFRGDVLVRRALANSLNVPAVQVMEKVGIPSGLDMAKRLGITTLGESSDYGLSLVLGAGEVSLMELTSAYGSFANGGNKITPVLISKIDDKNGKNVFTYQEELSKVLNPEISFLLSSILSDNQARSEEFGNALTISRPAAVKTGTTNDYKDSWTIGYTPSLVVGVWVGNNDNTPMNRVAGSLGAAPIWRNLMEQYLRGTTVENFTPPVGVNQISICRFNGLLLRETSSTSSAMREYFLRGTEPTRTCLIPTPTPSPSTSEPTLTPPITPTGVEEKIPPGQEKRDEEDEEEEDEDI